MMFDVITAVTTNLFRTYTTKRFMGVFFLTHSANKKREYICYSLFYILTTVVYLLFHYPPANIATNIIVMYIIACTYEGEHKKKILVALLIYGITMISDILAVYSFSNYNVTKGEDYNLVAAYVSVLLIALCEFIIERIMLKRGKDNFAPPYWYVILVVPFISIVVLLLLIMSNLNNRTAVISVSAGILLINLVIFYLYNALIDAYRRLEENAIYEMQIASYANQLDLLKQTEEMVNALRHDMKHHLTELYILSKENANLAVATYIEDMQKFITNDIEYVRSGNKEIDSILNYMLGKANRVLDNIDYKISIPKSLDLKPFDITILFGNLLENAIEAARSCQGKKWLFVSLQYEKGMLFLDIKNSYSEIIKCGDTYLTTKKEKGHGIGLQNVKRIVTMYHGNMEIYDIEGVFEVRILLYI